MRAPVVRKIILDPTLKLVLYLVSILEEMEKELIVERAANKLLDTRVGQFSKSISNLLEELDIDSEKVN